jgi:hypothetical protein
MLMYFFASFVLISLGLGLNLRLVLCIFDFMKKNYISVFWCFDKAPKFKMSKVIWSNWVWQAHHKCSTHAFVSWGLLLFNVFAKLLFTCENHINEYEMKIKWAWMKRCCHFLFLSMIAFFLIIKWQNKSCYNGPLWRIDETHRKGCHKWM